jgi:hypothetical protein
MHEFIVFLHTGPHNRLCALVCPDEAETYTAGARDWLAMAAKATGPPLP